MKKKQKNGETEKGKTLGKTSKMKKIQNQIVSKEEEIQNLNAKQV